LKLRDGFAPVFVLPIFLEESNDIESDGVRHGSRRMCRGLVREGDREIASTNYKIVLGCVVCRGMKRV
jgi:hypothetical protein